MTTHEYYRGQKGRKYGIYNTQAKCFQFGISEDTPALAEARLFQLIGNDARKWRFEPRALPPDGSKGTTEEQLDLYGKTVRRLARGGAHRPVEQIVALAEEIERYRSKIYGLENQLDEEHQRYISAAGVLAQLDDMKESLGRVLSQPNCNDCGHSAGNTCGHCPRIGENIRINCPLWKPEKEGERRAD